MIVYIGSAIDTALGSPAEQFKDLASAVVEAFPDQSAVIFNPLTAYVNAQSAKTKRDLEFIVNMNTKAVMQSDIGFFSWTKSQSYGVPIEINSFANSHRPFVLWVRDGAKIGLYLQKDIMESGSIVYTREDAITALRDSWEKKPSSNHHEL